MMYRWVGAPGHALPGVPCHDLDALTLAHLAAERGWTVAELQDQLDASPLFQREGAPPRVARAWTPPPPRERNK